MKKLQSNSILKAAFEAPLLMLVVAMLFSFFYRLTNLPVMTSDSVAFIATLGLSLLAFAAGAQFRISQLAKVCPVSFRLSFGGGPLFLISSGLAAFILIPQITLAPAFLLGGILMLNGSAFDRRSIIDAPTPALVKAGVRLESAVILVLGLPVVVLLEANASAAQSGQGILFPLLESSKLLMLSFAIGGFGGLIVAVLGNLSPSKPDPKMVVIGVLVALFITSLVGGQMIIAGAAFGLIWGEQSRAHPISRIKLRARTELYIIPAAYLLFGFTLFPLLLEAELLMVTFALATVTIIRAVPRLVALQHSALAKEGQVFLAWFGGTPGVASALFLLTLVNNSNLNDQELLLTVGALCVVSGVFTARLTSRPLSKLYIRSMASAHRRRLFN